MFTHLVSEDYTHFRHAADSSESSNYTIARRYLLDALREIWRIPESVTEIWIYWHPKKQPDCQPVHIRHTQWDGQWLTSACGFRNVTIVDYRFIPSCLRDGYYYTELWYR